MIIKIKKSLGFGDGSEKKFYAKAGKIFNITPQTYRTKVVMLIKI